MITISVEEVPRDFAGYLHRVRGGEMLLVGLCAGQFTVPADFDDRSPEDILWGSGRKR